MADDPKTRREVQAVSRWVCIILWTLIMAPALAFVLAFPLAWILFFVFPGYMFNVGPPDWACALYLLLWIGGTFLLGFPARPSPPPPAAPTAATTSAATPAASAPNAALSRQRHCESGTSEERVKWRALKPQAATEKRENTSLTLRARFRALMPGA